MKAIILLLFFLSASGIANSQPAQDPAKSIRELKDGVLVVRLRTKAAKIAKLEELMKKEDPEGMRYNRLAIELGETRQEVEAENRLMVRNFRAWYRFSDVLFVYDTLAPQLKEKDPGAIFLNDSLKYDPAIVLGDRPFLVAGMGMADPSGSVIDSDMLVIYDRNFSRMQPPFPAGSGVTGVRMWWKSFSLDEDELLGYFFHRIIVRLDRKLQVYYERVNSI